MKSTLNMALPILLSQFASKKEGIRVDMAKKLGYKLSEVSISANDELLVLTQSEGLPSSIPSPHASCLVACCNLPS